MTFPCLFGLGQRLLLCSDALTLPPHPLHPPAPPGTPLHPPAAPLAQGHQRTPLSFTVWPLGWIWRSSSRPSALPPSSQPGSDRSVGAQQGGRGRIWLGGWRLLEGSQGMEGHTCVPHSYLVSRLQWHRWHCGKGGTNPAVPCVPERVIGDTSLPGSLHAGFVPGPGIAMKSRRHSTILPTEGKGPKWGWVGGRLGVPAARKSAPQEEHSGPMYVLGKVGERERRLETGWGPPWCFRDFQSGSTNVSQ